MVQGFHDTQDRHTSLVADSLSIAVGYQENRGAFCQRMASYDDGGDK